LLDPARVLGIVNDLELVLILSLGLRLFFV